MEYCGIDLHAEYSQICILDEGGEVMETSRVRTSRKALERFFARDRMRVVMEAGGTSAWVSRLLGSIGHEVVVCSPRRVRLTAESSLKNDKVDAEVLARLVRLDPEFLKPIQHRSEQAQLLRANLKVRSAMVEARTKWINTIRGLLRSFGYNVSGKVAHTFVERVDLMKLPDDLRAVIAPLLEQLDLLTGEIERRNEHLEELSIDHREPAVRVPDGSAHPCRTPPCTGRAQSNRPDGCGQKRDGPIIHLTSPKEQKERTRRLTQPFP